MLLLVAAAVRRFLPRPFAGGTTLSTSNYTYDVFDRRIQVADTTSGTTTTLRTIYDGANAWADFGNTNVLQNRYLYTRAMDEVLARLSSTSVLAWDLPDLLGSVRDISDGPGTAVIDHIKYDSYGNILAESSPASGDRFKYTAREWDTATSQYFYRARYYSSTAGRFTSQDPIKFDGGDSNILRYVANVPTKLADPTGLHPDPPIGPRGEPGMTGYRGGLAIQRDTQHALTVLVPFGVFAPVVSLGVLLFSTLSSGGTLIGSTAVVAPGLGPGVYPALVINGTVYVARFHNEAAKLAGSTVDTFYGFARIDAAKIVLDLIR